MKNRSLKLSVLSLLMTICVLPLPAQLALPPVFSDNMVLQQLSGAPIWGTGTPDKEVKVSVSWDGKEYRATVNKAGKWMVRVQTPSAGGPYTISIVSGIAVTLKNVLVGEVWFCSGQSNMEMPLAGWGKVHNFEKEISEANYPEIRLLQVEKNISLHPVQDMKAATGSWQECTPGSVAEFSATAYFFGRHLYENLNIPVGLIHSSWGGTFAEAWTSGSSLKTMPAFYDVMAEIEDIPENESDRKSVYQAKKKMLEALIMDKDFGYVNNVAQAASLSYDDSDWKTVNLPGVWERSALPGFDGYVWFRKEIDIPASWMGRELTLSLGGIDDNEITWFNGVETGRTDGVNVKRQYTVPSVPVQKGKAVITVRVTDTGGDGGFYGNESDMFVSLPDGQEKISLAGDWKYKVALTMKETPSSPRIFRDDPANPASLFNAMVNPFIPYVIRGAIWYQGENNERRGYQYRDLFPLMINDWRKHWGYDFPFYFAQLANYKSVQQQPAGSEWAELREAQSMALRLDNTGMAVLTDIGEAYDIHPKNKQDVGKRLALIARHKTYGEDIEYSGPVYHSYKIEGNKIRISFKHTSGGLKTKNGEALTGFSIAGVDHKFHWADAVIEGDEVIVSCRNVEFPVASRYAWADNPVCNLYNGAGLPASPFRTDDWPGITYGVEY